MTRHHLFRRQRGTALLVALLITALAASLAAQVASQQSLLITQSNWSRGASRAELALQYGKQLAMKQIYEKIEKNKDHLLHIVPVKAFDLGTIYGAKLTMTLVDAQTKWNINALSSTNGAPQASIGAGEDLAALLKESTSGESASGNSGMLPVSALGENQAQILAQKIQNYIQPYTNDAVDSYYMRHQPPFYPGHQLMMQITQMRGIDGINRALYQHLSQVITALPTKQNMININDLPMDDTAIASALGISDAQMSSWKSCRQSFMQLPTTNSILSADLNNCTSLNDIRIPGAGSNSHTLADRVGATRSGSVGLTKLTTHTNYVFVNIQAKIGIQKLGLHALLYIGRDNRSVSIGEIWQDNNLDDSA